MGNEATVEPLPATTEQSATGMEGNVSEADYAAQEAARITAKRAAMNKAPVVAEATEATAEEATDEAAEKPDDVEATTDAEGDTTEGDEQPKDEPDATDEPVLSKLDPDTQKKIDKRIGKLTARAKEAEEKLARYEAEKAEAKPAEDVAPVVVSIDDPADKTGGVASEADLAKLEQEARSAIEFIENNDRAITRAIARDEATVSIGGTVFDVDALLGHKRDAEKHLARYIPQRRSFLQSRGTATSQAKELLPALFDKNTAEHQEWSAYQRKNPAIRSMPDGELIYAQAALWRKAQAEAKAKKPAATKASATPPKSGADTGSSAAASKPKLGGQSGEKARLTVELGQATKRAQQSGSTADYEQMLILQAKLKKL